ncbi:MAG: hypothetical protein HY695_27040 [Deltaproteobacteria bacterium]|nr:hypothetical protein [Deltaproteobacteria bacterium]
MPKGGEKKRLRNVQQRLNSAGRMNFQIKKTILLTGAGFAKPFNGSLAEEMFVTIYNRICDSALLRDEMKK